MRRSVPVRTSLSPFLLSTLACLLLLAHPACAQAFDHSCGQPDEPNGRAGKLFDDEVLQRLRDRPGGVASVIQVVTSACQSEYFAREGSRLNGDWSSAASRGARFLEDNTWSTRNTYRT